MLTTHSKLLGFDFRVTRDSEFSTGQWTDQRRNQYLLNPSVQMPLSVDRNVWPSLFCFEGEPATRQCSIRANPEDFHQQGLRLWANLSEMRRAIEVANCRLDEGWLMGVTLEDENVLEGEERWQMAFDEPMHPTKLDTKWELKGYDVADKFFVSGLSNCGYGTGEIQQLRAKWKGSINENGLFRSIAPAKEFKEYANNRIASHAPFYIFGLHQFTTTTTNSP